MNVSDLGGVISGNKAVQIEAKANEKDLQKAALYLFAAIFLGQLLANFVIKKAS